MATRLQYCPVCQMRTKHEYKRTSVLLALLLLCAWIVPGVIYIAYGWRRADRTAHCMNDHRALAAAREGEAEERMARLVANAVAAATAASAAAASGAVPAPKKRGTGFMTRG